MQPQMHPSQLTRHDDQVVTLLLPPVADYEISQPETLLFTIPPAAVASRQTVYANVSLVIMPAAGFVALNGSLLRHLSEGYVIAPPPLLLDLRLHGDTWEPNLSAFNSSLSHKLVKGFSALTPRVVQLGALRHFGNVSKGDNVTTVQEYRYTGWDDQVRPGLQAVLLHAEEQSHGHIPPAGAAVSSHERIVQVERRAHAALAHLGDALP